MYIRNSKSSSDKEKNVKALPSEEPILLWLTPPTSCEKMATSKYIRLYCYLVKEFNTTKNDPITLTFNKIETEILNKLLPKEAKTHGAWWRGNSLLDDEPSDQAKAWILAGWDTENPNVGFNQITFKRAHFSNERVACQELLKHRYNIG